MKADGLAAGKGVTVARDRDAAVAALRDCLEARAFGDAGATVLVEELLEGPEVSAFALVDAHAVVPLALSQDFKRVGDGDTGPNTGGMGAYSPLPWVDPTTERAIWADRRATVARAGAEGVTYRGLLYTGLMLTADGPKVLEYNCRFGDPETEAVIPRLAQRPRPTLLEAARDRRSRRRQGRLARRRRPSPWCSRAAATRARTRPACRSGPRGRRARSRARPSSMRAPQRRGGTVVTAGGRVLAVSGLGATIDEARATAYEPSIASRSRA